MSAALEMLNELARGGVVLYLAADGKLKFKADPGAYTQERRELVAANREAFIAALCQLALGGRRPGAGDKSLPAEGEKSSGGMLVRPTPYWRRRWAEDPELRQRYGLKGG